MKINLQLKEARGRLLAGTAALLSLGAVGLGMGATLASAQSASTTANGTSTTAGMGAYGTGWVDTVTSANTATTAGSGAVSPTSASSGVSNPAPTSMSAFPAPMVVSVDQSGNALVRGIVTANSGSSLSVQSWGGTWTVQSGGAGATTVVPNGSAGAYDLSAITVGDFVGVNGTLSGTTGPTVNASFVRDWTKSPLVSSSVGGTTGSVSGSTSGSGSGASGTSAGSGTGLSGSASSSGMSMLPQGASLYAGTATGLNAGNGTFTLTDASGQAYAVMTDANTTFWDSASNDIGLGSMSENDPVRIDARTNADGSLQAIVVRDTALGAAAAGSTQGAGGTGASGSVNGTSGTGY